MHALIGILAVHTQDQLQIVMAKEPLPGRRGAQTDARTTRLPSVSLIIIKNQMLTPHFGTPGGGARTFCA
jgi:hypothetical protein